MCVSAGSAPAAIAPPSGTAVWRIPSASPRSSGPNQLITARPLADCVPPANAPATASAATRPANDVGVRSFAVLARDLEQHRQTLQPRACEECAQSFAHQALTDVLVAVAIRSERRLRVVRVQDAHPIEAAPSVEIFEEHVDRGTV